MNVLICSQTKSAPQFCKILISPEMELFAESIVPLNSTLALKIPLSRQPPTSVVSVWLKLLAVRIASIGPDTIVSVTVNVSDSLTCVVVKPEQLVCACAGITTASNSGFVQFFGNVDNAIVVAAKPFSASLR